MIYPIVVYGSPVLRQIAKDIDARYPDLGKLLADMYETMYTADGMGLAAPQIGKSVRVFVMDATTLEGEDPSLKDFKKAFINPHIMELNGESVVMNEGCLSLPKLREDVDRHNKVRIQYYDENWKFFDEVHEGLKARIIQHEYDHLNGILFIDRIPAIRKKLIKGKLNDITKGKVNIFYKTKLMK
ncbi:MAG TPA: peptide deformylase [Bacteroidales bacterium]|nr:peptide deformylase [Bacteroidales bacterium]